VATGAGVSYSYELLK